MMKINVPESEKQRIVIVGGGFAGLALAKRLYKTGKYQIVLIDKNNFHQFQPLLYQVAMSGLEPSSIVFPFRKMFQKSKDIFIRMATVQKVQTGEKHLVTSLGICNYDILVLATGAETNYFGNTHLKDTVISMKSISDSLYLRNSILEDFEKAISATDFTTRQEFIDIVIVGGGPTGVEVAGALAEMKKYVLPKDYTELDCDEIDIWLIQGGEQLLSGMSSEAAAAAKTFLEALDVKVCLNTRVMDFDGTNVHLQNGEKIRTKKVIWAAGVKGAAIPGLPQDLYTKANRIEVNRFNQIDAIPEIFVIGDLAYMREPDFPNGHPQVAQVAMQHARQLADNLKSGLQNRAAWKKFKYTDRGSMATIGRNKAVVDLPQWKFQGFFAWMVWLGVHLFQILGVRNKVIILLNWFWNYFTYDQALRLIIKPKINPAKLKKQ